MTSAREHVTAACSRFFRRRRSITLSIAFAAVMALATAVSIVVTVPATGSPRLADVARSQVRISAPSFAQVPATPDKSLALRAARTATLAAQAAHAFHVNHVAHMRLLAARRAAARATAAAAAYAKAHPAVSQPQASPGGFSVSSSFQQCVISRESGGNPGIWNASGHWGLYQFSYSTWVMHGGAPSLFGHASAAYQTEIFWNTVRADGGSDWSPYDGCQYSGGGSGAVTTSRIVGTPPVPASGSLEYRAMKFALTRLGDPYVWAAAGPSAFDCSGLVVWSYAQAGKPGLPHFTGDLWNLGYHVSSSSLRPGDLVFFYSGHSHVGIYIGGGRMVDAPHTGSWVKIQPVDWASYSGAVRI